MSGIELNIKFDLNNKSGHPRDANHGACDSL